MKPWIVLIGALVLAGCSTPATRLDPWQTQNVCCDNPTFLPANDPMYAWETIVNVVDDYFDIEKEKPVQTLDYVMTEGRIDTFPQLGATLLEPWHDDSVGFHERLESTLQPIRRHAHLRVVPVNGGYSVEVIVYKEIEVVAKPDYATEGRAVFLDEVSQQRIAQPSIAYPSSKGWRLLGRDTLLEQRIIAEILHASGNR